MKNKVYKRARRILEAMSSPNTESSLHAKLVQWFLKYRNQDEVERVLEELWREDLATGEKYVEGHDQIWERYRVLLGFPADDTINREQYIRDIQARIARRRAVQLRRRVTMRVAAVLLPLFIWGGIYFSLDRKPDTAIIDQVAEVVISTSDTSYKQLILPDNSQALLNTGSSVKYPETYLAGHKEIFVEGEVYLNIQKSPDETFYVRTQHAVIEVKGTSFNVRAFSSEDNTVITLHSGSILVTAGDKTTQLYPTEEYWYNYTENTSQVKTIEETSGWWTEPIVFNEQTLGEIFEFLAGYFNTKISYEEGFDPRHYTIKFDKDDSIDEIMRILSIYSGSFTYEITADGVVIR